jgi:PPP family 3-phenylpropionic acid transporter
VRLGGPSALIVRISIVYFAYFFFLGVNTPFVATWLKARALDSYMIAAIGSASIISRTVGQPILSYLAEIFGRRALLIVSGIGAAVFTFILALLHSPDAILAAIVIAGMFIGPVIPLADSLVLADRTINYGRARLWGSIGFAVANIAGGALIQDLGASMVIWLEVAGLVVLAIVSFSLPTSAAVGKPVMDLALIADRRHAIAAILRLPITWIFILAAAFINGSHAYYYLFSVLYWKDRGFGEQTTGILWAWGVLCEVAMLGFLGSRTSTRSGTLLMLIGGIGAMVRWTGTAFNPPFWSLIVLQSLHGLTYGAMHLGAMQIIRHAVPAHISTATMGVYAAVVNGVVIGTVMALLGGIYEHLMGDGFLLMAAMGALGTALAILFSRLWNGGLFIKSATNET